MNEFIVWDEDSEIFIDETKCILVDGTLFRNEKDFANKISDDLSMFFSIGLKDINGKSIYADSSIVEFKNIGSNYTGYFTFDLVKLCYKIIVLDIKSVRKEFIFNSNNIENIKIIDTIQQNKLGLIK